MAGLHVLCLSAPTCSGEGEERQLLWSLGRLLLGDRSSHESFSAPPSQQSAASSRSEPLPVMRLAVLVAAALLGFL
jgi:hypothetical protein